MAGSYNRVLRRSVLSLDRVESAGAGAVIGVIRNGTVVVESIFSQEVRSRTSLVTHELFEPTSSLLPPSSFSPLLHHPFHFFPFFHHLVVVEDQCRC